jgi:cell division protein FtsW
MDADTRIEYSLLYTATLCLLAVGAVMVYSASSAEELLGPSGDASYYLRRYVVLGAIGLACLQVASRVPPAVVRALTLPLLLLAFVLTASVMVPGVGVEVNGATRWLGAGPVQFQPSELLKVALVLYAAQLLAGRPASVRTLAGLVRPLLVVVGLACTLLLAQPDMGTAIVICLTVGSLLVAAGARIRHLAGIGAALAGAAFVLAVVVPYRRERLTSFLDPWSDSADTGFQAVQAMIAIGSGGVLGVGLGESVQKILYLPEAHTDMIVAIIGEELGVFGIAGLVGLYGLLAYAGLRTAKLAREPYEKLLAAGLISLVLCQAVLNLFAVMGMAPLTGVPLPFVSYGNSNLIVLLTGMGLVLGIARRGGSQAAPARPGRAPLRAVAGGEGEGGDRRRGDRGARGARAGGGRRAAG